MKIIELYSKLSKGEIIPKYIKVLGEKYEFDSSDNEYYNVIEGKSTLLERISRGNVYAWLNCEIEIPNEEDKDIPLIPDDELWVITKKGGIAIDDELGIDRYVAINSNFKVLKDQINIIIKEFNEYRKEEK